MQDLQSKSGPRVLRCPVSAWKLGVLFAPVVLKPWGIVITRERMLKRSQRFSIRRLGVGVEPENLYF